MAFPLPLLCRFSRPIAELVARYSVDTSQDQNVGPFKLPIVDRVTATKVQDYLLGACLIIGTTDADGTALSPRTMMVLVQLSSFAHIFDIAALQQSVMHALHHFLVLRKQHVTTSRLDELISWTDPGCPARRLLTDLRMKLDGAVPSSPHPATNLTLEADANAEDSSDMAEFFRSVSSTHPPINAESRRKMCKNRQVHGYLNTHDFLRKIKRGLQQYGTMQRGEGASADQPVQQLNETRLVRPPTRFAPGTTDASLPVVDLVTDNQGVKRCVTNPWQLVPQYLNQLY